MCCVAGACLHAPGRRWDAPEDIDVRVHYYTGTAPPGPANRAFHPVKNHRAAITAALDTSPVHTGSFYVEAGSHLGRRRAQRPCEWAPTRGRGYLPRGKILRGAPCRRDKRGPAERLNGGDLGFRRANSRGRRREMERRLAREASCQNMPRGLDVVERQFFWFGFRPRQAEMSEAPPAVRWAGPGD